MDFQNQSKNGFQDFWSFHIGAIVVMSSVALINYFNNPQTNSLIYLLGAILFTISDIVLIFNTFGKTSKFYLRVTNLLLYYLGQLAIALSLLFI